MMSSRVPAALGMDVWVVGLVWWWGGGCMLRLFISGALARAPLSSSLSPIPAQPPLTPTLPLHPG